MSESTSLREAIAKLLHADGQGVEWDTEYPRMKRRYLGLASEILEVLADPPDDVIEKAARALFLEDANVSYVEWPEWDSAENLGKPLYIENAAAAFRAAFGGEQA